MWNLVIVIQSPKYVVRRHKLGHKSRRNTRGLIMPPSKSKTTAIKITQGSNKFTRDSPRKQTFLLLKGCPPRSFKGKLSLCGDILSIDATTKYFK